MGFNRRTFLQTTSSTLLALGLATFGEESWIAPSGKRYLRTLAQSTNRKLALLVGINKYPNNLGLSGCLTDVELQRELLIYRFGFHPEDILILQDRQATRENIETAFIEHLTEQAKSDDVVVFHYSGYGNRVKYPSIITPEVDKNIQSPQPEELSFKLANSLMPIDGILNTRNTSIGNDLLEETLILLARSLATEKLTMILDTSYVHSGKSLQGNLRVRSFPNISEKPNPQELATIEQLKIKVANKKRGALETKLLPLTKTPSSGIVLSAAGKTQAATETFWDGFSAGLFTYALTQYLWQITPASKIQVTAAKSAEMVESLTGKQQIPSLTGDTKPLFTYYTIPKHTMGAEGVITSVDSSGVADIYLGGLPTQVLRHYGIYSCLSLENSEILLQIRSKEAINVKAQFVETTTSENFPKPGQLVRESIRVLPRNIGLSVALSNNLERIERVDATSAVSSLSFISSAIDAGLQSADCLLARVNNNSSDRLEGYGLFSIAGIAIANTAGLANEAVKSAINRLTPQLKSLLAAKLLSLTVNEGSSRLGMRATLELIEAKNQPIAQKVTLRSTQISQKTLEKLSPTNVSQLVYSVETNNSIPSLTSSTQIQCRVENLSDRLIYLMLLAIDTDRGAIALCSPEKSIDRVKEEKLKNMTIEPGMSRTIPEPSHSIPWRVSSLAGFAEIYLVASIASFDRTLAILAEQKNLKLDRERAIELINPLDVVQAMLEDLHAASAVNSKIIGSSSSVYALDVNAWTTLSFTYKTSDVI